MVKLDDIAQKTGFSVQTISNILNSSAGRYSAETRKKVIATAQRLGYSPNSGARMIRRGRFDCISLVTSHVIERSVLFWNFIPGIISALEGRGVRLMLSQIQDEKVADPQYIPDFLRESMSDGIIMHYFDRIPPVLQHSRSFKNIPCIWTNVKKKYDCVHPDDYGAAYDAVGLLVKAGHRRIAYVNLGQTLDKSNSHYSLFDRSAGYEKAMKDAGLKPVLCLNPKSLPFETQQRDLVGLFSSRAHPTAVVTYGWSLPTLKAAYAANLQISRDLSIVTFEEVNPAKGIFPVALMKVPVRDMGSTAALTLLEKIENPRRHIPAKVLKFTLEDSECIRPPSIAPYKSS